MKGAAEEGAKANREVMGLLLGDYLGSPAGNAFTVALDQATAPLEASAGHVRFDPLCFEELARSLDEQDFDYVIVGWFHSHLGLGCFMSATDEATQRRYFRLPHQFALVIDPVRKQTAAFRSGGDGSEETQFRVFSNGSVGGQDYRRAL